MIKIAHEDFQFTIKGICFSIDTNIELFKDCVSVDLTKVEIEMFNNWTGLEITEHLKTEILDHLDGCEEFYNRELAFPF